MKKSECFRLAQCAVVQEELLSTEEKIKILRVLMSEEDMAKFCEQRAEAKSEEK